MLMRALRSRWFANSKPKTYLRRPASFVRPRLEQLEGREVPTITFNPIQNFTFPGGKDLFVPLSAVDSGNVAINYSASSSNSKVTATVMTGGETVKLSVSGNGFSGDLYLRLFDNIAPNAAARIVSLVNSHFYDGLTFHRVIQDFMAQGGSKNGDGTGGSGLGTFDDELNSSVAFVSPGLLALANSGDDTNDAQFFIVDTDLSLAQMPQHLNYDYTIFGQLVGGFDVFTKMMATPVEAQSAFNSEVSKPVTPVIINSATIVNDDHDGVLRISAPADFTGTSSITVTASNAGDTEHQGFSVQSVLDTINDRPFLGSIPDQTVSASSTATFNIPATDLENDQLTYIVRDPANFSSAPANVTVTVDQGTHTATVTPLPGFTGNVDLLFGVRDQTNRARAGAPLDDQSNFDTQRVTLHVVSNIDLDAASDTGLYNDDNFTGESAPSFTIHATAGRTVTLNVNGAGSFAATESSPGVYKVTLPAGKLQLGPNTIGATVTGGQTPETLAPLTVTFAPTLQGVYVVPGAPGSTQQMTFTLGSAESAFSSEVGFFAVDDFAGHIGTLAPGDAGYAAAALGSRKILMTRDQKAGASTTLSVTGGQFLGFYLIQNNTSATFLAKNSRNSLNAGPVAFFSFTAANPDHVNHVRVTGDPTNGRAVYAWEDLTGGGDRDYNDRVFSIRPAADATPAAEALHVPGTAARNVAVNFKLLDAMHSLLNASHTTKTTAAGEVGLFLVDGADGRIGNLHPGDAGYAQAALSAAQVLFANGAAANSVKTIQLPGGSLVGFYLVMNGSASAVLSGNPTDAASGNPKAFFSFSAANPDSGATHFRTFSPEGVTEPAPTGTDPLRIHAMGTLNGTSSSFDDVLFTVDFASVSTGPPVINSLALSPTTAFTNDTLTATVDVTDPAHSPVTLTYVWKVNGVVKQTTTTSATTDHFDLSQPGNGDRGQVVSVEVTPNDGSSTGAVHSASVTIANSAPSATVSFTPASVGTNDTLTAHAIVTDADADIFHLHYVWKVNGAVVRDVNSDAVTDALDLSVAGNGDKGQTVTVEVTPTDEVGAVGNTANASTQVANTAPSVDTLAITPNPPAAANLLTANLTASDVDNDSLSFTYTWKVNDVVKQTTTKTATSDTFDLSAQSGIATNDVIAVEVVPNDGTTDGALRKTSVTVS